MQSTSQRTPSQKDVHLEVAQNERFGYFAEFEVESLRRYRGLADAIPHVVCRAKGDGSFDDLNRGWIELTGLSVQASLGDLWQQALQPDDLNHLLNVWADAMMNSRAFEAEARVRRKDGSWRWHLVRGVAEKRENGEVAAWILIATDIDECKRIESQLRRAKDEAESANLAKTQFLANMSHEIRTPLTAILGFSELLLSPIPVDADEQRQNLQTIRRNGEQLLHLINEILDISKVESGNLEIEEVQFSFKSLLNEMSSLFCLKSSEKSLDFTICCGSGVPAELITDPVRLRQIFNNVVGNAIKFTQQGSVEIFVNFETLAPTDQNGILKIQVTDTGIGISKQRSERLFKPFSQADSSTTRRFGGTGLGLALSKKIAVTLGGNLFLKESSPAGSVFEFSVPCKTAGAQRLPVGALSREAAGLIAIQEPERLVNSKYVLVVDDAPDNQVLISRYLALAGAKVDLANNGFEAVGKVVQNNYDIIFMDIQMPGMDGYAATRALRESGVRIPIIALTAHALKTEREKCLAAGFNDHLSKPVDRARLIEVVANCRSC
jgi:PAS domain S-box-containing protein